MNVALIHLELGVGGTEQLLVNAAICLLNMGHDVKIYTSHYDPDHCFAEAKRGGKLADKIVTCGDWLPRCDVCSWGFFVLGGGGAGRWKEFAGGVVFVEEERDRFRFILASSPSTFLHVN